MSARLINWKVYLAVGIGGMIGAVGRYSISLLFDNRFLFPVETLIANFIGCFLLSFILNSVWIKKRIPQEISTGLTAGVIGAFTTFSTFAVETVTLSYHHLFLSFCYVFISIIGGLILCYLGYRLANKRQENI
ncbi:fluoride efflux transporter FluC [Paucisalibacillus globulus]|uniref:fluoride efflux transporter FluC n=1 Tax=Paucisalibacillus globulus TaxID=351095 RepID=UPI0004161DDE|nr:CrcB family protein [Paucisalibacillus globulus]